MNIGDLFGIDPSESIGGAIVLRPDTSVTEENSPWLKGASLMASALNAITCVLKCSGCNGFTIATYEHADLHGALGSVIAIAIPISMVEEVGVVFGDLDILGVDDLKRKEDDDKSPGSSPLPKWLK